MTTTMRLLLSMAGAKRDDRGILVHGRSEARAQRRLALRGVGADRDGLSLARLHVGLLPDDVVDALCRELARVGEMDGVREAETRIRRHLAPASLDTESREVAGEHRLMRQRF